MIWVILLFSAMAIAVSAQVVDDYVVDEAGIFSAKEKGQLISFLKQLEQDTSAQVVVYIVDRIPPDTSLEEYSLRIAEENKIGRAGNDNGVLFFLATQDRAYRWEVGYGLEDVLNTPLLGRVSRVYMVPQFQQGSYTQGILDGIEVVSRILKNSTDEDIMQLTEPLASRPVPKANILFIVFMITFFIVLPLFFKGKKGKLSDAVYFGAGMMLFSGGFGRGGGGFGGGGFSGGGGGFGGGGFSGGF